MLTHITLIKIIWKQKARIVGLLGLKATRNQILKEVVL